MPLADVAQRVAVAMVAASALAAVPARVHAKQWPDRPVKLIVPIGAGGFGDIGARYLAQQLSERFKQSFVVENRPGAASVIGTTEVARAAPDGYTLLVAASPHINLEIFNVNKPYQLMRDFVAVAPAFSTAALMVVHPSVPAKNMNEFIALAKSKPGALTYASSGPGSNKHLGAELFKLMTGTDILHVPYRSSTVARNDLIGGHVNMMFDEVPSVGPNVLAGQVRALGITGFKRSSAWPDIPTVSEAGVSGYEHTAWLGLMAPAGTPPPIVDRLNEEIRRLVAKPDVKEIWLKQGADTMSMTPAEYDAFLRAEIEKWSRVVKAANVKLE
jgi:tripartite-type tricarboxylate transporter receptor subunit TctC